MPTTIEIRPTGLFPDDRITIQDAIDAGYDEIVLMAETAPGGTRVAWNLGGDPGVDVDPGNGMLLPKDFFAEYFQRIVSVYDDTTASENLIIRGEALGGLDLDGDPDYVVVDGGALTYGFDAVGSPFPNFNLANHNFTIKNLHFTNSPNEAISTAACGDFLAKDCKITNVRPLAQYFWWYNQELQQWVLLGTVRSSVVIAYNNLLDDPPFGTVPDAAPSEWNWPQKSLTYDGIIFQGRTPVFWEYSNEFVGGPIASTFATKILVSRPVDTDVLIQNCDIRDFTHDGISLSSPSFSAGVTGKTVEIVNNTVRSTNGWYAEWRALADDNGDIVPGANPDSVGIAVFDVYFPNADKMPVSIKYNEVITKNTEASGVIVTGPCRGCKVSKNTISLGPSHFTGGNGIIGYEGIALETSHDPENAIFGQRSYDSNNIGSEDIIVSKNQIRGETIITIAVWDDRDYFQRQGLGTVDLAIQRNCDIIRNHVKFANPAIVQYVLGSNTSNLYLRVKPPKEGQTLIDFGTNNDIDIPGVDDPGQPDLSEWEEEGLPTAAEKNERKQNGRRFPGGKRQKEDPPVQPS